MSHSSKLIVHVINTHASYFPTRFSSIFFSTMKVNFKLLNKYVVVYVFDFVYANIFVHEGDCIYCESNYFNISFLM